MDFDLNLFEDMEAQDPSKTDLISKLMIESSRSGLSKEQLEFLESPKEAMYGLKDSVIFLVDCQALLFNNENIERSNLELVKDAYLGLMRRKVVFHSADKTGMVFFNCGLAKNPFDTKGVYVLDQLDSVSADKIRKAQAMESELNNLMSKASEESNLLEVARLKSGALDLLRGNAKQREPEGVRPESLPVHHQRQSGPGCHCPQKAGRLRALAPGQENCHRSVPTQLREELVRFQGECRARLTPEILRGNHRVP